MRFILLKRRLIATIMSGMMYMDVPLGIRLIQKIGQSFGPISQAKRVICYKVSVVVLTYFCYLCYHMTRKPISVVKSVLHRNCSEVEIPAGLEISPDDSTWCDYPPFDGPDSSALLGALDLSFLFAYGCSMFVSGLVAERVSLRYFLTLGLLLSAIFTYLFGVAKTLDIHSMWYFVIVQALGGICQSTGWPGVVTVIGRWFGKSKRGLIFGIWNSHMSIGNIVGTLIAGHYVEQDWSLSFIVPALLTGVVGISLFLFLVDSPNIVNCEEREEQRRTSVYRHIESGINSGDSSDVDDTDILVGEQGSNASVRSLRGSVNSTNPKNVDKSKINKKSVPLNGTTKNDIEKLNDKSTDDNNFINNQINDVKRNAMENCKNKLPMTIEMISMTNNVANGKSKQIQSVPQPNVTQLNHQNHINLIDKDQHYIIKVNNSNSISNSIKKDDQQIPEETTLIIDASTTNHIDDGNNDNKINENIPNNTTKQEVNYRPTEQTPILEHRRTSAGTSLSTKSAIGFLGALRIPGVIEFSLCLFFSKLVSYTFLFWLPLYIQLSTTLGAELSADVSTLFDVGAIFGAIIAGVISDYSGMSACTCAGMLIFAVPMLLVYQMFGALSVTLNVCLLFVVGILVNGPYSLITTSVSAELGTHSSLEGNAKALATVTAIIDGTGSIGAAVGPLLAGLVSGTGWQNVFYMLMISDVLALLLLVRLVGKEISRRKRNPRID